MSYSLQSTWNARVGTWHHHVTNSPAFERVREDVLRRAAPRPGERCLDLGAGTGFLTLPLAELAGPAGQVMAVDLAPAMVDELAGRAAAGGLANVVTVAGDLTGLRLPPRSLDVVVSSYALHHVADQRKREIVARAHDWLIPGGRLVVADMMMGRGLSPGDAAILSAKVRALAAKGPGGLWRIAKNVTRLGLRIGDEMPAPPAFWVRAFRDAGLVAVEHVQVVQEAGIVSGRVA